MRSITLGRSEIAVSAVGLGGIQFSKISKRQVARRYIAHASSAVLVRSCDCEYSQGLAGWIRAVCGRADVLGQAEGVQVSKA